MIQQTTFLAALLVGDVDMLLLITFLSHSQCIYAPFIMKEYEYHWYNSLCAYNKQENKKIIIYMCL